MVRNISELYQHRCNEGGNINEHLPILYMLSLDSDGVCEFGIERGIQINPIEPVDMLFIDSKHTEARPAGCCTESPCCWMSGHG